MEDYSKLSDEELSMLVAEKVMGWTVQDGKMHGKAQKVAADAHGHTKHSFSCGCSEDFHPTTDIADAMIVVEKMWEKGWWATMLTPWNADDDLYHVRFTPHGVAEHESPMRESAINESLPRAICLAALATVSNQEDRT